MAAIGKIRQNSGLLLIVIGGAMVAFVLSDMFSSGGRVQEQYVGEIAGNAIDRMEYEQRVSKELESRNSVGQATSPQETESIRNSVWNNMVRETVMFPQMAEAGITVTPEEFDDLTMGENILPEFKNDPTFVNEETGQFDPALVQQYLDFVRTNPQYRSYWELQRQRIINQRMYNKYNNMISGGLMANHLDAKQAYYEQNRKANLSFVAQNYSAIPDSSITYTEKELKEHYNKVNKGKRFKQNATRNIEYVVFDVTPTHDDTVAIKEYLADMKEDFENTQRDSIFTVNNSDSRTFARRLYKPGTVHDAATDSLIMSADSGAVVGPYREQNKMYIAKVLDKSAEEQARVRHILLTTEGKDKEEIRARADSLLRVVKRQDNFEEMVTQFSDDPGSVQNGGVYEWFNRQRMVAEFTDASFDEKVGAITIAETQYGFHIVEVLGQREQPQRNIIALDQDIEPSNHSFEEVYQEANAFSLNYDKADLFASGAKEKGLEVQKANDVIRTAQSVGQIQNPTELVRWAYSAEEGKVSEPIEIDNTIIVALLTRVKKEGIAPFEDVKDIVKGEVIKEKKAEKFQEQMSGHGSLQDLAEALSLSIRNANDVSFANPTLGGSREPQVVAMALTLESGQMSTPLKGETGVYVVQVESIVEPMEVEEYTSEKQSVTAKISNRAQGGVYNALKEKADVKDERSKFY